MTKKLVRRDKNVGTSPEPPTIPSLKVGDFVLLNDDVYEYCTGGNIRTLARHQPCRVMQVSPSGKSVLLGRPVVGWVLCTQVTVVEGPVSALPVAEISPKVRDFGIKPDDLEILLPVTRPWAVERVCRALALSDVPRGKVILILDAPGCEKWRPALEEIGFTVEEHETGAGDPPPGRIERRKRHRKMRRLSQKLVHDGPLLLLEDDTIVPPHVFERLSSHDGSVTGVQVSRHDEGEVILGVQGFLSRGGVAPISSCGHYCLLTTGEQYKKAKIVDNDQAVDEAHTSQIRPLYVDWSVICGHLTERGDVLVPDGTDLKVLRDSGRPLTIGALVHMYPPHHNAGAEHMLHAILAEAVASGHEARVVISQGGRHRPLGIGDYIHNGVGVYETTAALEGVDCIMTHLDRTTDTEAICTAKHIPCVQLFHNHYQTKLARVCDLAVYNSRWLAEEFPCGFPSVVVPPPVDLDAYRVDPGEMVTLINLSAAKGANIFYALAERFPKVRFLGVKGAYGDQIVRTDLKNVVIWDNQEDVREVYRQTAVLLVPSIYESYGRVAVEASASGIPVIANSTPGLKEALGDTGVYPSRKEPLLLETRSELSLDNLDAWTGALQEVMADWSVYSDKARTLRTDPKTDIQRLLGALQVVVRR